jgi:hypothetical protein
MVPTELDKRIKEILDQRSIQPSADAWEKLSGQLPYSPHIRPGRTYRYWFAAAIAGLLIMGVYLIPDNQEAIPAGIEDVVQGNEGQPPDHSNSVLLPPKKESEADSSAEQDSGVVSVAGTPPGKAVRRTYKPRLKDTVNKESGSPDISSEPKVAAQDMTDEFIDDKAAEVAARVAALEALDREVTEAEVEQLLRAAQEEIIANNKVSDLHSVDAMALLSEVESNLDQTFRDQIFEKLKSGYEKVRTAVADRNN